MATPLTVRPYQPSDRESIIRLWQRAFPNEPAWNEPSHMIDQKAAFQGEWFFVCTHEEQIVGTVLAGYDGVRGWVHKVCADPAAQRMGVASQLMQAAEAALASAGCGKLNLQVRAGNDAAIAFYRSAGYAVEDRVSMGKHLKPAR